MQEDSLGEIISAYWTCHLELSSFLCHACHVTLLFQVKTENPPLLFCLLIYHFLSSVSIKPMTTMLVFFFFVVCVCVCVCVARVCFAMNVFICFCKPLGSHEMGHHKLTIIFFPLLLFHVTGLVLQRRNCTEKNTLLL